MSAPRAVNPVMAGLRSRCPRCGQGALFDGYLKVAAACPVCGLDYAKADSGDGPAVFVVFIVGAIVVPLALVTELALAPPVWLHMLMWLPLATGLTLALLRPFKAMLVALQFHHRAADASLDDDGRP